MYKLEGYINIPNSDLSMVLNALPDHIKLTLAEPGCISFSVTPSDGNKNRYNVLEEFNCKAAFLAHQARIIGTHWAKVTQNVERHYVVKDDAPFNFIDNEK